MPLEMGCPIPNSTNESVTFSRLAVAEYRELSKHYNPYDPDPFVPHSDGPWHERVFPSVVDGVSRLLARYDSGLVKEQQLLRGKDNDRQRGPNGHPMCYDTLSYWLYYQHHKGDERDKLLGQRYWSIAAVQSWHRKFNFTPADQRRDRNGRYSLKSLPKKREDGPGGLVSEHVVPKKEIKKLLLATRDPDAIASLLRLNLCCVVTIEEDGRLQKSSHPNPDKPWQRYCGKGIILAHNPAWRDTEIEPLLGNGLLSELSLQPAPR